MRLCIIICFVMCLKVFHCVPRRHQGTRQGSFFYDDGDGYFYHINNVIHNSAYLKCVRYERGCLGRAIWYRGRLNFNLSQQHQCRRDRYYSQEMELRRKILARCRRLEMTPFSTIIREERGRFPEEVQLRVNHARMRTSMRNARLSRFPPPPATLRELTNILQNPNYRVATMTTDGRDNLYAGSVTADDGTHCVIFASRRMLTFARMQPVFFSDGTFKSAPLTPEARQVFTILTSHDHHVIPIAWVLMESRTMSAYVAVLRFLRLLLGPGIALEQVITDYEVGQQGAWLHVFQDNNLDLQGCLFHMARAFIDYAKYVLNLRRYMARGPVKTIIRLSICLALVPQDLVQRAYIIILVVARNMGLPFYRRIRPFLSYVSRRWVHHRDRRTWMNCCGSENRTNNIAESHNRQLSRQIGSQHPNIYVFLLALAHLESDAHLTVRAVANGVRIHRQRRITSILTDERLQRFLNDLRPQRLNARRPPRQPHDAAILRYLRRSSYLFENVYDDAFRNVY